MQSGAHSKKPRMMRGSELLKTRVSELEEFVLAETEGFAYIPQAAVWLASQTLRIPHAMSAGTSLVSFSKKNAR